MEGNPSVFPGPSFGSPLWLCGGEPPLRTLPWTLDLGCAAPWPKFGGVGPTPLRSFASLGASQEHCGRRHRRRCKAFISSGGEQQWELKTLL